MKRLLAALTLVLAVYPAAGRVHAQQVLIVEGAELAAIGPIRDVVSRGNYQVFARDTLIRAGDRVEGDMLVTGGVVRLEGTLTGSAVVLPGGELFVRPRGRVLGAVIEAGGGLYLSENASVGERVQVPAAVAIRVDRTGDRYRLEFIGPPPIPRARPDGLFGLALPLYDRVNGLTLPLGGSLLLTSDTAGPRLAAAVAYHSERGDLGGRAALTLPLSRTTRLVAEAGRGWTTNERWIRGDLANAATTLAVGSDARNYYERDRVALSLRRAARGKLSAGESAVTPRIELSASRDRSLVAGDPWSLFGGSDWRPNPAIDEGTIVSVSGGAEIGWRGMTSSFLGQVEAEWAPPALGDFEFALARGDLTYRMLALANHSLGVRAFVLHPLTGGRLPAQRWTFAASPSTLPTAETGSLRGDHVVFIGTDYRIPLPALPVPLLGIPSVLARHGVGAGWVTGFTEPRWEQSLGIGIAFPLVEATVDFDPATPGSPQVGFAVTLPL